MPHPLFLRLMPAALALLASGCAMFRGSPDDFTDDAMEMQPNPRRTETPSLLGPGSERITTGTLPMIRFAPESWRILPSEESKIRTVAQWFTGHPERVLVTAGAHASSPEFARQLSDLRSQTVRKALITAGVPASKILAVSFGEDAPSLTGGGVSFSVIGTGEKP